MLRSTAVAASLMLAACVTSPPPAMVLLQGETMGSAWTVKIAGSLAMPPAQLQSQVQAQFDAVNLSLSTYRNDSALSRFNDDERGEWVDVDPELATVMAYALSLAPRSGGAYDITVGPLVNLWGFGPDPTTQRVPDAAAIKLALARVGWRKVEVDVTHHRARKAPGVRVDLSSLGKGRGVDRVAEYLDSHGLTNYLIDLSGKLRARGRNATGEPWRVAVETPGADDPAGGHEVTPAAVSLIDGSIATAGDYRRYFEIDGRHYSHIIDPRTGFPVTHATVSATALGADCMEADALATVFMVMAPDAALRLANELAVPALLISRENGAFRFERSEHWPAE